MNQDNVLVRPRRNRKPSPITLPILKCLNNKNRAFVCDTFGVNERDSWFFSDRK